MRKEVHDEALELIWQSPMSSLTLGKVPQLALPQHICMQKQLCNPSYRYLLLLLGFSLKTFMQENGSSFTCTE